MAYLVSTPHLPATVFVGKGFLNQKEFLNQDAYCTLDRKKACWRSQPKRGLMAAGRHLGYIH